MKRKYRAFERSLFISKDGIILNAGEYNFYGHVEEIIIDEKKNLFDLGELFKNFIFTKRERFLVLYGLQKKKVIKMTRLNNPYVQIEIICKNKWEDFFNYESKTNRELCELIEKTKKIIKGGGEISYETLQLTN